MTVRLPAALAVAALAIFGAQAHDAPSADAKTAGAAAAAAVTLVFDKPLPNVPGKSMKGVLVEYGPGGSTPAHAHAGSAFIYATVLEGAIRSKVNDGPEKTYRVGENFFENPGDRHGVSANASDTAPAKLLAVFVVDTSDMELTTPIAK